LDSKVDEAALEAFSRLPHGEMVNLISPSVALFLAAFGRLDPFDPGLMYLWVLLVPFGRFELTDTGKDASKSPTQWHCCGKERLLRKTQAKLTLRINPDSPARLSSASKCPHSACLLRRRTRIMIPGLDCLAAKDKKSSRLHVISMKPCSRA